MSQELSSKQATLFPTLPEEEDVVGVVDGTKSTPNGLSIVISSTADAAKVHEEEETKNVVDNVVATIAKEEDEVAHVKFVAVDNVNSEIASDRSVFLESEKKALAELKELILNAMNNHEFTAPPPSPPPPPSVDEGSTQVEEDEIKEETTTDDDRVGEADMVIRVNEDGIKTVEAIEETVVVHPPHQEQQQQTDEESSSAAVTSSPLAATVSQQEVKTTPELPLEDEEVSIWGVPLLKDERTHTILWKFLRARDFKVNEAFDMIKSTIKWRNEFKIDELLEEELGEDLEKAVFMHGVSKEGHPVCYNVYGAFQDRQLYQKTFSDEEKRQRFLKWRIQSLEKSIRNLDFYPGGISTIVQVNDLKNSPGPGKWELRQATKQALHLLQDNYPEFVAKQVFINVPWWYVAVNKMINPFLTQRTKSKFVVAGPSKSAETLFRYIAPEQVAVQYGGLSKEGELGTKDGATQIIIKPSSKETVEFAVTEACHLTWEVRVLGWNVSYGAEFVPNAKDGYTVIIQKMRKVGPNEETIISNTFKTSEPGKVVFTIDNCSSKKKRLLYRLQSKLSCD